MKSIFSYSLFQTQPFCWWDSSSVATGRHLMQRNSNLSVVNVWLHCPCHVVAPAILQSLIVLLCSSRGCCVVLAVS